MPDPNTGRLSGVSLLDALDLWKQSSPAELSGPAYGEWAEEHNEKVAASVREQVPTRKAIRMWTALDFEDLLAVADGEATFEEVHAARLRQLDAECGSLRLVSRRGVALIYGVHIRHAERGTTHETDFPPTR